MDAPIGVGRQYLRDLRVVQGGGAVSIPEWEFLGRQACVEKRVSQIPGDVAAVPDSLAELQIVIHRNGFGPPVLLDPFWERFSEPENHPFLHREWLKSPSIIH